MSTVLPLLAPTAGGVMILILKLIQSKPDLGFKMYIKLIKLPLIMLRRQHLMMQHILFKVLKNYKPIQMFGQL
jgi:hypothetical protein